MIKYAHIGYAKAGSTWLQNYFFGNHNELYHLGKFKGSKFINDDILLSLWIDMIEKVKLLYDSEKVETIFKSHFDEAENLGYRACGISHEPITNTIRGKVDFVDRAYRLRDAMGKDTQVIIIIREQLSWIKSLYSGLLKEGGLTQTFDDFLFYFYYDQDISPFSTLFYDKTYELYADLFGVENVHIIPFELLQSKPVEFINSIAKALRVTSPTDININPKNSSPSPQELYALLEFNKENSYYLGNNCLERLWGHTIVPLYEKRFGIKAPSKIYESQKKYMKAFSQIGKDRIKDETFIREKDIKISKMKIEIPISMEKKLLKSYQPHNASLQNLIKTDLSHYGYVT